MAAKESRRRGRGVAVVVVSVVIAVVVGAVRALRRSASPPSILPGWGAIAPSGPVSRPVAPPAPAARVTPAVPVTPAPPVAPDDLTAIDGIGPKISAALVDAGITTYRVLAETSPDRLREVLAERGFRFAPTLDTWPAQARNRSA